MEDVSTIRSSESPGRPEMREKPKKLQKRR